jgi:hypothetical protein
MLPLALGAFKSATGDVNDPSPETRGANDPNHRL